MNRAEEYEQKRRIRRMLPWCGHLLPVVVLLLSGCAPLALTAVGVGAAAGVQHTLTGIAYKTFTLPLPRVRTAAIATLKRMDISVTGKEKIDNGESIKARAADREIEIQLEAVSSNTTRMRASVRTGMFMDSATATEIIIQTDKTLNGN